MTELVGIARFKFNEGKLDEFKAPVRTGDGPMPSRLMTGPRAVPPPRACWICTTRRGEPFS